MKTSLVATVLNEETSIEKFIQSTFSQTKVPNEIIIVDGGSTDNTLSVISNFKYKISNKKIKFVVLQKKGNRSVGRNEAIRHARGDIILCSDAGCVLDKKWVENITKPFRDEAVDVVAGYYKGKPTTIFQKCLIPYVLVMPDRVNPNTFLPATRSMAFRKSIWKKIGGFPEEFSHNEDYVFAKRLQKKGARIAFQKDAIAYWIPRKTIKEAFVMFFRFAYGDAEAKIFRPKALVVLGRHAVVLLIIVFFFISKLSYIPYLIFFILLIYLFWATIKNYRYVNNWQAIFILPLLQFAADFAVLTGTVIGLMQHLRLQERIKS